jgi:hypothetical protein
MPFEISANPVALNVYNNLAVHQSTAATALAKISSGEKAADPSQVAITGAAVNLKTTLAGTQSAITSTQTPPMRRPSDSRSRVSASRMTASCQAPTPAPSMPS